MVPPSVRRRAPRTQTKASPVVVRATVSRTRIAHHASYPLQPAARRWARNRTIMPCLSKSRDIRKANAPVREFHIAGTGTRGRTSYLDILLRAGWKASGETDPWDLEKGGTRVLIATEYPGGGITNCLFRVWGSPEAALALESELKHHH